MPETADEASEHEARAVRQMQLFGVRGHMDMAITAAAQAEQRILVNPGNVLPDGLVVALTLAHADRAIEMAIDLLGDEDLRKELDAYRAAHPEVRKLRDAVEHFDDYLTGKGWKQVAESPAARTVEKTGLSIMLAGDLVSLRVGASMGFDEDLSPFEVNVSAARLALSQLRSRIWSRIKAAIAEG